MNARRPADTVRTLSVRARMARRSFILVPAALASLPLAQPARAAQIGTSWMAASNGSWFDATKWSAGVPNNAGANVFDATVGAVGSPYAVTLNNSVNLNSLTLSSPAATINHTTGTLVSTQPINISAGTYLVNGGTISGGTINLSGTGTLAFGNSSGILNGTVVNGGLAVNGANSSARLLNGARFTGNGTIGGSGSILNYEYDATIQPGQTITLDHDQASMGIARNSTTSTDSTLTIAPGATVHGRGRVTSGIFSSGNANRVVNNGTIAADVSGGTLNIDPNIFVNNGAISGAGSTTFTVGAASFTNNGSVNVNGGSLNVGASQSNWTNAAGRTIAVTNGTFSTGGTWSNAGTIAVTNSTLNLGGTFTTAGMNLSNLARSGGTVNLTGKLDNTAATLALTPATGALRMVGGTIKGGTITRAGGADLVFTGISSILDGATIVGDANLAETSAFARFQNGGDFTGNATLTGLQAMINYEYDVTIGAGRTINLDGPSTALSVARNAAGTADSTLTIAPGAAVRGRGQITSGNFGGGTDNRVVNNRTISADLAAQTLTINPNVFTNNGHARAQNGAALSISAGSWSNAAAGSISIDGASTANFSSNWSSPGALRLSSGATLNMGGTFATSGLNLGAINRTGSTTINLTGNLNNAGSALALTGTTGSWRLHGATINGGTITRAGGADLVFTTNGGALSGVTIPGDVTFTENSSRVSMRDGADFTGSATLAGTGALLNYEYDATIGAGRTINLNGPSSVLGVARGGTPAADRTLTIGPGALVRGRGQISSGHIGGGTANRVVNNGMIAGDVTGAALTVDPNLFTNNAALRSINGSSLTINAGTWSNAATGSIELNNATGTFSGVWSNAGSVILNNATLNLAGTMTTGGLGAANFARTGATTVNLVGSLNNNASTLALNATSGSVRLAGGTITGGTITRSGGADLIFTGSGVLDNARIIGDVTFEETSARARMRNGADFTGNAALTASGALLNYEYDATIGAGRTINLDGSSAALSVSQNSATSTDSTLTIAPGAIVRGRGQITSGNFTGGSTNHVVNNGLVHADVNGSGMSVNPNRFTNNGTLQASNGGSINVSAATFANATGRMRALSGGKIKTTAIAGNLNDSSIDGASSMIDLDGASYTINQPMGVTHDALLYLRGGWQKNADLNVGGRVVFDYASGAPSPFASIKSQIVSGFANGAWNGPGINSAQAAANPSYGVGYAEMPTIFGGAGLGTFAGVIVDRDSVLVGYTRYGDADLNFTVNLADFNRLAGNFGQSGKLWTDGDFDYNGTVNLADFNKLASNFGLSAAGPEVTPEDWARLGASVPEPTSLAIFGAAASVAMSRRRRRR